jgi:hypothetical protein
VLNSLCRASLGVSYLSKGDEEDNWMRSGKGERDGHSHIQAIALLHTFCWFLTAEALCDGLEGSPYCSEMVDNSGGP